MSDYKPVYLVMVSSNNNNKYYRMLANTDGETFTVQYGRVGASSQTRTYPLRDWDKKYNEKIRKGYVDQTHLMEDLITVVKPKVDTPEYKEIEDAAIAEIVNRLMSMAKKKVQQNYRVESNQVTQAMVDEAQKIIDSLTTITTIKAFNEELMKLFTTIPRKMSNVNDYLAKSTDDFSRIIKDEQDLLDVMRGQVITHSALDDEQTARDDSVENFPKNDKTILEAMGIVMEPVNDAEIEVIKDMLGDCKDKFYQAWRVTNLATQKRFDDFVDKENIKDVRLFWHGSRNENWWSIINNGLMIRPTNAVYTGSMFGDAIYASPTARKSLGYTSLSGSYWARGNSSSAFMALMNFHYGKPYDVYSFDSKYYNYNYKRLREDCPGANCLHAHAGSMLRNDEIVFYNVDQVTIKYLVELR
jgi:poly [ADP-ribose] polymerase